MSKETLFAGNPCHSRLQHSTNDQFLPRFTSLDHFCCMYYGDRKNQEVQLLTSNHTHTHTHIYIYMYTHTHPALNFPTCPLGFAFFVVVFVKVFLSMIGFMLP
uniref:Uncharacterized protein n=1 Tax=Octopus bimaculoides TaxID=37653 RepID=A0A0L8HR47_OCTBM